MGTLMRLATGFCVAFCNAPADTAVFSAGSATSVTCGFSALVVGFCCAAILTFTSKSEKIIKALAWGVIRGMSSSIVLCRHLVHIPHGRRTFLTLANPVLGRSK